jgi:hypothetical protein
MLSAAKDLIIWFQPITGMLRWAGQIRMIYTFLAIMPSITFLTWRELGTDVSIAIPLRRSVRRNVKPWTAGVRGQLTQHIGC